MPTSPTIDGIIPPASEGQSRSKAWSLWRWWQHRLFYVHPGLDMIVAMTPIACLHLLDKTGKPDVKRLEDRNLFAGGRRYHVYTTQTGFVVLTTSKPFWRYRGRTSPSAVVYGDMTVQENRILLNLTARIRLPSPLSTFFLPIFLAPVIVSMVAAVPWPPVIRVLLIMALIALSWAIYRSNAALESYESINYIQQVLKPFVPEEALSLETGQDVVYDSARFARAWEDFYQHLKQDV